VNYLITHETITTGDELRRFVDDLLIEAGRFAKSIPVFLAAASLFEKEGDLNGMSLRVGGVWWGGMHGANKRMIERDVTMKEVVKHHVIPLMQDFKNQMLEVTSVREEDKCKWMSRVLSFIAMSKNLVDDNEVAEEVWKETEVWEDMWRKGGRIEEDK